MASSDSDCVIIEKPAIISSRPVPIDISSEEEVIVLPAKKMEDTVSFVTQDPDFVMVDVPQDESPDVATTGATAVDHHSGTETETSQGSLQEDEEDDETEDEKMVEETPIPVTPVVQQTTNLLKDAIADLVEQETKKKQKKTKKQPVPVVVSAPHDGPILSDPNVLKHARVLCWIGLDPAMRLVDKNQKERSFLKSPLWNHCWDLSAEDRSVEGMITYSMGVQKEVLENYAGDFYFALCDKHEVLAGTLFFRLLLVGKCGSLHLNSDFTFVENDYAAFPFLPRDVRDMSVWLLVYAILTSAARKIGYPELALEIIKAYTSFKDQHDKLRDSALAAVVAMCRRENTPSLEDEPLTKMSTIISAISKKFSMPSPASRLDEVELYFYVKCMDNVHPVVLTPSEDVIEHCKWHQETVEETIERLKDPFKPLLPTYTDSDWEDNSNSSSSSSKRKTDEKGASALTKKTKKVVAQEESFPPLPVALTADVPRLNVRTNKDQKFVYYLEEQKCVIKGPYTSVKRIQNLHKLLEHVKLEERLDVCIVKPLGYFRGEDKKIWIQYPLLHSNPGPWTKVEKIEKNGEKVLWYSPETLGITAYSEFMATGQRWSFEHKYYALLYKVFAWFTLFHVAKRTWDNVFLVGDKLHFLVPDSEKFDPLPEDPKCRDWVFSRKYKREDFMIVTAFAGSRRDVFAELDLMKEHLGVGEEGSDQEVLDKAKTPFYDLAESLDFKRGYFGNVYRKLDALFQF